MQQIHWNQDYGDLQAVSANTGIPFIRHHSIKPATRENRLKSALNRKESAEWKSMLFLRTASSTNADKWASSKYIGLKSTYFANMELRRVKVLSTQMRA